MNASETRSNSEHGRRLASDARTTCASRRQTGSPDGAEATRDESDASQTRDESEGNAPEVTCTTRYHDRTRPA